MISRCLLIVLLSAGCCLAVPTRQNKTDKLNNDIFPIEIKDTPESGLSLILLNRVDLPLLISKKYKANYTEATLICQKYGLHLIKVDTKQKKETLKYVLGNFTTAQDGPFWMGGNRNSDGETWRWQDGELIRTVNWDKGEPNNAKGDEMCIELYQREGVWDDQRCSERIYFICEGVISEGSVKSNGISENKKVVKSDKTAGFKGKKA